MPNHTFVVHIDESGDEGFRFGQGSSEWFVLSAVIVRKVDDIGLVHMLQHVRAILNRPAKKHLHFKDLRHEHRLPYLDEISRYNLQTVSILVHKPSLDRAIFSGGYILYFYAVRYLLERVSWLCRDGFRNIDQGDGSCELIFSNRSSMPYNHLVGYLNILRLQSQSEDIRIEWNSIVPNQLKTFTPGKRAGLQVADAIAGSYYKAVEYSEYGFTESRYAEILRPVCYEHGGRCLQYGIKIWPYDATRIMQEDRFSWVRDHYQ